MNLWHTSPLWILYIYIYLSVKDKNTVKFALTMAGFIVPPTLSTQENSPNFGYRTTSPKSPMDHGLMVPTKWWFGSWYVANYQQSHLSWAPIFLKSPSNQHKNLTSEDRKKVIWKDAYIYIIWIICISTEKLLLQESAPLGITSPLLPADFRGQATIPPPGGLGSMLPLAGGTRWWDTSRLM